MPDSEERAQTHRELLTNALGVPPEAAQSAARDRTAPQPTRKPSSDDVELERIAAAQRQNAADDARRE